MRTEIPTATNRLWDTKQRQGHSLHRICAYQGSFPPQLPAYFLDKHSGEAVLDPFCGRGTVLLEAVLRGRTALGFDILPTARALASVKVSCPTRDEVLSEIAALRLDGTVPSLPDEFSDLYHEQTWIELCNLKKVVKSDAVTALALGRMHGHSSGFFSAFTFNAVSVRPPALRRLREKHGGAIEYRDVRAILMRAAKRFIPEAGLYNDGSSGVGEADARALPLADGSIDVVITSPPFLDVIDYPDVNWVREWFVDSTAPSKSAPFVMRSKTDYSAFLRDVLTELCRVVRPGGVIVFEVGPVKRETRMDALVQQAAVGLLKVEDVVVNEFARQDGKPSVPKISRAMGSGKTSGKETTTMSNQCVVLRR